MKQEWKDDGKGGTELGFGACVFDSSVVLSHLLSESKRFASYFESSNRSVVVELGCGCGLVSIVAAARGAFNVFATDGDEGSLRLARENVEDNLIDGERKRVAVKQLLWGDIDHTKSLGKVDLVVGSDIVACPYAAALPKLVDTLLVLTESGARVVIAYKPRLKEEDIFFTLAKKHFDIEWVPSHEIHRDYNKRTGAECIKVFVLRRRRPQSSGGDRHIDNP